jgi:hypothetical protein
MMIPRKRIYDFSERISDRLLHHAAQFAFPGRGEPLPPVLMVALPKSGSIFLQRALRRTLRVPVHHIASAGMSGATFRHADLCRFERGNVVCREHLQPRAFTLKVLAKHGVRRAVLHVRDPRAAIVSWTRHMDRVLASRGLRSVELSCELPIPEDYGAWSFEQRLGWQVAHKLPSFVRWIEDWLRLVEISRDVEILVTDYAELCVDAGQLVRRILDFNGIEYCPDWIEIPSTRYGKNNIFSILEPCRYGDARTPDWMARMAPETLAAADALVPVRLRERFGWARIDGRAAARRPAMMLSSTSR